MSRQIRKKVTRACDYCKKRKIRCDGAIQCYQCIRLEKTCTYNAEYARGRDPLRTLPTERNEDSQNQDNSQQPTTRPDSFQPGAVIYRRIKDSLNQNVDPPLPPEPSIFLLPPIQTAQTMLGAFFDSAPRPNFLHRSTVEDWMNDMYTNFYLTRERSSSKARNAIILMIFASAHRYMDDSQGEDLESSFRYFQAAESQLKGVEREIRLVDVQVRLLQCFYLLSRSRIHHCWTIFGVVVNLTFALDLNRKESSVSYASTDLVEFECRKRVFWTAYTLDKYLSCALGRPQAFNDEDTDQEIPLTDDENMTSTAILVTNSPSKMLFDLQFRLSVVMGRTLKELYGIRPVDIEIRLNRAEKLNLELQQWRRCAAPFMEDEDGTFVTSDIVRKAVLMQKLTYAHTQIMVYRPFLLNNFKLDDQQKGGDRQRERLEGNVKECFNAALYITELVGGLYEQDPSFNAYWFIHYIGYTAAVVLFVYVLQNQGSQEGGDWARCLSAAETCRSQLYLASSGEESFAQRCSGVLKELHEEVTSQIRESKRQKDGDSGMLVTNLSQDTDSRMGPAGWIGLAGVGIHRSSSVIDRIDQWGFSSLTGY